MNRYRYLILSLTLILNVGFTHAKSNCKWGKVSKQDLALKECSFEKDAEAVVLFDNCSVTVSYSMGVIYNRHVRIKLLKETALNRADIHLSYYRKNAMENISNIKAQTINVSPNGKLEKLDVDSKSVFTVDVDDNYGEKRFSLPQVKVGSIIEYKYSLHSKFYTFLDTWYFQTDIPTVHSQMELKMPEGFDYRLVMLGRQLQQKYNSASNKWSLNNLPSIKEEPYINNYKDYIEQIRFQLAGYYTQDNSLHGTIKYETTMTSWKQLAQEYDDELHSFYRKVWARKQLETILKGDENSWQKIEKIYDWVRLTLDWNGKYRLYPKQSPPQLVQSGIGTNAEINHLLVLLLREAGIISHPGLARTNDLGLIQKVYSMLSQFNQVMAYVEVNGKKMFLDATSKYRPYTLVSREDLNYTSFVVDSHNPRWELIMPSKYNREMQFLDLDFSNMEEPVARLALSQKGYYAAKNRNELTKNGFEGWGENLLEDIGLEGIVDTISVENFETVGKSLNIKCSFSWETDSDKEELVHLNPFLLNQRRKNPFQADSRQYRIDFNFPFQEGCNIKIIPPVGYEFVEFPKSRRILLPNHIGKFELYTKKEGADLKIRTKFEINHSSVSHQYYTDLKEFYHQMIKALQEQVVLKKTI
ncbi:MAG: DUF3857 and transglutaminase domain-containing protein [Marinifilaceae bacterium]